MLNQQILVCESQYIKVYNQPFITYARGQILELPFEILWLDKANEYIRKKYITALWIIYVEVWFETVSSFPNGNSCCYLIDGHTAHTKKEWKPIDKICSNTDDDDDGRCETKRS